MGGPGGSGGRSVRKQPPPPTPPASAGCGPRSPRLGDCAPRPATPTRQQDGRREEEWKGRPRGRGARAPPARAPGTGKRGSQGSSGAPALWACQPSPDARRSSPPRAGSPPLRTHALCMHPQPRLTSSPSNAGSGLGDRTLTAHGWQSGRRTLAAAPGASRQRGPPAFRGRAPRPFPAHRWRAGAVHSWQGRRAEWRARPGPGGFQRLPPRTGRTRGGASAQRL